MEVAALVTAPRASNRVPTLGSQEQTVPFQTFLSTWLSDPSLSCSLGPLSSSYGALWLGHLLWPAFSRGHSEEGQQSPQHVVVMEFILLPLSVSCLHLILLIEEVLATATENGDH